MATIPQYEQQVAPQSLPDVHQSVSTSGAAFGEGVGEALGRLGETTFTAGQRIDYTVVGKAKNEYQTAVDKALRDDWLARRNDQVQGLPQESSELMAAARKNVVAHLSQAQVKLFDQHTADYNGAVVNAVTSHTRSQLDSSNAATAEQTQVLSAQSAAALANSDDPESDRLAAVYEQDNANAIAVATKLNGLSGARAKEYAMQSWTKYDLGVVQALLTDNDPSSAQKYLDEHADRIDPLARQPLRRTLAIQADVAAAGNNINTILQDYSVNDGNFGFNLPGARAAVAKIADPNVRERTDKLLTEKFNEIKQMRTDSEVGGAAKLFEFLHPAGKPTRAISDITPQIAAQLHFSPALIERLAFRDATTDAKPVFDATELAQRQTALFDRVHEYDLDKDKDQLERLAISRDLLQLEHDNPDAARAAISAWNLKFRHEDDIPTEIKRGLYYNANGKSGGIQAEIYKAVQDSAMSHIFSPSTWLHRSKSDVEISARSLDILQRVKAAIVVKKMQTLGDVREYLDADPEYHNLIVQSTLGHWEDKLGVAAGTPVAAPLNTDNLLK